MVFAVNNGDVNGGVSEMLGRINTGKSAAYDHYVRLSLRCRLRACHRFTLKDETMAAFGAYFFTLKSSNSLGRLTGKSLCLKVSKYLHEHLSTTFFGRRPAPPDPERREDSLLPQRV